MAIEQEILATFQLEFEERLQVITDGLLKLEKGLSKADRQKVLDEIFRAAHTIKGAARSVSAESVGEIAHHVESLFSILRRKNAKPTSQWVDLCLQAEDRMREAMEAFQEGEPLRFDLQRFLNRIKAAAEGRGAFGRRGGSQKTPSRRGKTPAARSKTKRSGPRKRPSAEAGQTPGHVEGPGEGKAGSAGEPDRERGAESSVEVVRVTADKVDRLGALTEELQIAKLKIDDHFAEILGLRSQVQELAEKWGRALPSWQGRQQELLTVDLQWSADAVARLKAELARMQNEMRTTVSRLGTLSTMLGTEVRLLRLVAASTVIKPLAVNVREMARELNKKVNLEISGEDVEMERGVLQKLRDPLIHLFRNAIDHGIESPERRRAAGKPEVGKLALRLAAKGSRIEIQVEDDGAGISPERVVNLALKQKLITPAEAENLRPREALDLIFRPGFSSKETITHLSGRGVGLDVVQTNLRATLKGSCRVETVEGKGTVFTLEVPLTLAAEHGLLVRAGGQLFAIPITSVRRIMHFGSQDVKEIEASLAIRVEGQTLPLRGLGRTLELKTANPELNGINVAVVIAAGARAVALAVEEVVGEREIVVKPLRPPIYAIRNITGGTLTGSGNIIIVLNPEELVGSALEKGSLRRGEPRKEASVAEAGPPRILVVDDSITTRNLEKLVLESKGYRVSVAVDGKEAWQLMQRQKPDALVTDVDMPEMDGFELTERVKQSQEFGDIPVVIVTALGSDRDKQRGIEVGADAYIVKGDFETQALLDAVEQLV